jgi:transcriptional regulator with XRE-family HTH domain
LLKEGRVFENLGRTIAHLRELKGFSQGALARRAGIGKSQLSKYEGGRELPKFDSLEKVLGALEVSPHQFFHLFYLIDRSATIIENGAEGWSADALLPPALLNEKTDKALSQILSDLVTLSRCVFEEQALRPTHRR